VLDRVTADTFAAAAGQPFTVQDPEIGPLELELVGAELHDPGAPAVDASGTRAPFTITFRGPPEPILPQRIYRLENHSVGPLEIFIVPLGVDAGGASYEAIFA
jgi:hypothetical protein